jgi:hypothetical protein
MPAFVQALLTGNSKTSGTSLVLSTSSPSQLPVTAGNDIFVAFACDDAGSAFSATDNLGNVYELVREEPFASFVKTQLWRAANIVGGTLTTITVSWTTALTAKAAVAGEFSLLGPLRATDGITIASPNESVAVAHARQPWFRGELVIGAMGWEGPNTDDTDPFDEAYGATIVGQNGTTGGSATSNIFVDLCYQMAPRDSAPTQSYKLAVFNNQAVRNNAAAGAIYTDVPSLSVIGPTVDV